MAARALAGTRLCCWSRVDIIVEDDSDMSSLAFPPKNRSRKPSTDVARQEKKLWLSWAA